jgi:hypothetical protein
MTTNFKENADGLQSIQLEHRLGRSLNDFFNARARSDPPERLNLDDYWTADGICCDKGIAIYSRRTFHYPYLGAMVTLPTIEADMGLYWLGFECGAEGVGGIAAFRACDNKFDAHMGVTEASQDLDVKDYLPAGYDTTRWYYRIKVNKPNVEFYPFSSGVGGRGMRAIILYGLTEEIPKWENTSGPYLLAGNAYSTFLPEEMTVLIEVSANDTFKLDRTTNCIVAEDGDPLPPRQYALYNENTRTKWNGLETSEEITSHPIPVWGYPGKTLLFQSNAAGTLRVQVYAGGDWRDCYSKVLTADKLEVYNLNSEVPIARCIYTPVNTDTIAVAEWYLS